MYTNPSTNPSLNRSVEKITNLYSTNTWCALVYGFSAPYLFVPVGVRDLYDRSEGVTRLVQ